MRWGVTGGMGSGKSTVAGMLQSLGAGVIDADALSRGVTAVGGAALAQVRQRFGADAIGANGAMDRAFVRQLILRDATAKAALEAIVHPWVRSQMESAQRRFAGPMLVFDVPLLIESSAWRSRLDGVLVVDCSQTLQLSRVAARSGLAPHEAQQLINAQATREQRRAAADVVIFNEGLGLEQLRSEVLRFWQWATHDTDRGIGAAEPVSSSP